MALARAYDLRSSGEEGYRSGQTSAALAVADVSVEISPTENHISLLAVSLMHALKAIIDTYTLTLPHLLIEHHVPAALCFVANRLRIPELRVLSQPHFELFVVAPITASPDSS